MPADLAEQIPWVHEACEALGVAIVNQEGVEADDVIGTLAQRAVEREADAVIVTGDKDLLQLVTPHIRVFNPRDEGIWYDVEGVKARWGVAPEQVIDVLALMGDSIDNIKGVPGIGEKGARDLIGTWGSLDRLLDHAQEVPQRKYREALTANADQARQSRELLRIRTDVPCGFDLDRFRYRGASRERCYALFSKLGFRSLVMEYAPTADAIEKEYEAVVTSDALRALAQRLEAEPRVALRVLADGASATRASLVGIAVSTTARRAWYVPVVQSTLLGDEGLSREEVLAALAPILGDAKVAKIGHDLKFDITVLGRHGVEVRGLGFDTMLASYLLDATRSGHPLEDTALEHLGYKALSEEDVCGRGVKAVSLGALPLAATLTYACERADLALQLADALEPAIERERLGEVYRELELPLVPVLVDIERAGVRVDGPALAAQSQRIEGELRGLGSRIYELAGGELNINSPKQLADILFERLKLPVLKRTGRTRAVSTAVEVLEELALTHELPRLVLEWRALQKLKGTYIDALPQLVDPGTGRVHTCFNQAVAATGRLSSSDPNLQNIPIRTELGREIRRTFIADPGHLLISADYSQIELRVLAHLSGDETLIEAFRRGDDIHDQTALKVFGEHSGLDPHELRRRAKIINYALLYGKTAFTLAKDIGVTQQAAQAFIDAYFSGFPRVREFIDKTLSQARETGVVTTLFGRRRLVPEITSRNGAVRAAAERVTVNMPIQGTAADILKRAMIDVHGVLATRRQEGAPSGRMILTVHDELLFEVPREHADALGIVIREQMEQAAPLVVPLTVDVGIGANWKDAKG
jgi:DNA polymerase-1